MNFKIKLCFAWMLIFFSGIAYAQTDEGPDPPPPDEELPAAPIDGHLVYLAILGFVLAYFYFKRYGLLQKKPVNY